MDTRCDSSLIFNVSSVISNLWEYARTYIRRLGLDGRTIIVFAGERRKTTGDRRLKFTGSAHTVRGSKASYTPHTGSAIITKNNNTFVYFNSR